MQEVIERIAQVASDFSAPAGIGACETAGMIVSVLAAHPELTDSFMRDGVSALINDDVYRWENGTLSWLSVSGKIVSPAELRAHLGKLDQ